MESAALKQVSRYLTVVPRTLFDACRALGRDDGGRACAGCPLRDLCAAQQLKAAVVSAHE